MPSSLRRNWFQLIPRPTCTGACDSYACSLYNSCDAQVPLSIDSHLFNYNFCNTHIIHGTNGTRVELSLGSHFFLFLIFQRTDNICIMRVDVTKQQYNVVPTPEANAIIIMYHYHTQVPLLLLVIHQIHIPLAKHNIYIRLSTNLFQ